jgi:hypothetical protein
VELVPPGYAELGVGAVQVRGDGARGQEQPVGDFAVGMTLGGQVDDLPLLGGQLPEDIRYGGGVEDRYPAGAQFGLGPLHPGPRTKPPEDLEGRGQDGLGVVDATMPPQPLTVVKAQLCAFERPQIASRVRQRARDK